LKKAIPDLDIFPFGKHRVEQASGLKKFLFALLPYHTLAPLKPVRTDETGRSI
jgi:hypothetical protein